MAEQNDVMVVDAQRQFVDYTTPAIARRLLKSQQATVFKKSPFAIRLAPGLDRVPTWRDSRRTNVSEATPTTNKAQIAQAQEKLNARRMGYSFAEYFKDKSNGDEVWIQNITDMQISLEIEHLHGGQPIGKLIPPTPHPILLTDEFGFDQLKQSSAFKKALAKRRNGRPEIILLDAAQVAAYYAAMARQMNAVNSNGDPDIEAAMAAADDVKRKLTTREVEGEHVSPTNQFNFAPPKSAQELIALDLANRGLGWADSGVVSQRVQAGSFMPNGRDQIAMQEVVNPKILNLCQQVSPQIPQQQRMPLDQFIAQINTMTHVLRIEDWQHVEAHGTYREAKQLARRKIAELAEREGLGGQTDPTLSLAGQGQVGTAQQRGQLNVMPMPQGFGPQGPAALANQGVAYQGPTGFANANFAEAHGAGQSMSSPILGPNGLPLGENP